MEAQKPEDRDEAELVKQIKPLLQQAETILNQTLGAIKGADPDNRLSNKAKRHMADHRATPEEQRLAEALKVVCNILQSQHSPAFHRSFAKSYRTHRPLLQLMEEVGGTIEWARNKLDAFPKAKKDLSPLLDAVSRESSHSSYVASYLTTFPP